MDSPQPASRFENMRHWIFLLLSLTAVVLAVMRSLGNDNIDRDVLMFLATAGVLLVLERVIKFSVSKDGVSAEMAQKILSEVSDVKQVSKENQLALSGGVGGKTSIGDDNSSGNLDEGRKEGGAKLSPEFQANPNDPQKGRFGGESRANGREIIASVAPAKGNTENYDISLTVRSTDASKPLIGTVIFYLHHTFKRKVRKVSVVDGVATLDLLAYGAFTVGAVADDGETLLELDLSNDPRFPKRFRES